MKSVKDVLTLSMQYLQEKGIENCRRQAEELLCDVLGVDRMGLYVNFEKPLDQAELTLCRERLRRRGKGEPLAYLHGEVEFFGCKLIVSPDVLIPRQETELLVDKISSALAKEKLEGKILWDICCGSGCIGIALKKRYPDLNVVLADLSPKALAIAKKNAERNDVAVSLVEGDLLTPFAGQQAHYVVCNPPYISEKEYTALDREVRDYEPRLALVGGKTGLEYYERLAGQLRPFLFAGGRVWFETGAGQGEQIKALFSDKSWKNSQIDNDWAGKNRFFSLEAE